jgi:hypothetical protein
MYNAFTRHALQDPRFSDVVNRILTTSASTQQYGTAANDSCSAIVKFTKLRSSRSADQSITDTLNATQPSPVRIPLGVQSRDLSS